MSNKTTVGFHVYGKKNIQTAINLIINTFEECGIERNTYEPCIALFIDGPRNQHINITQEEMRNINTHVVFHAAYCDNLWGNINEVKRAKLMDHITHLCEICALNENGSDIVIHCTTRLFDEEISAPIMRELERIVQQNNPRGHIFVETMANDARFSSPRMLNETLTNRYVGLCIDTAHIWGSGATISTREDCRAWFSELRGDIPYAIHLNDSETARGSHRDVHANIGMGQIWEGANDGYVSAIEWAQSVGAPIILERSNDIDITHDLRIIATNM
jgi:endonuclease IV